jgi:hypothetical protein
VTASSFLLGSDSTHPNMAKSLIVVLGVDQVLFQLLLYICVPVLSGIEFALQHKLNEF